MFHLLSLLLTFSLFSSALLHGTEDEEALIVPLSTSIKLLPLYLSPIIEDHPAFSAAYLKTLEKIMAFDLNQNGMSKVVKCEKQLNDLVKEGKFLDSPSQEIWKKNHLSYVVSAKIHQNIFDVTLVSINGKWIKEITNIALTGKENIDREKIHALSDAIYKALFGKDGIATTKILYTKRDKIPGKNEWTSTIWECDYDGGNARQIIYEEGYCVTPQYAPPEKGKKTGHFFYVSYKTGQPKIYLASLKDGKTQRLSLLTGNQLMPTLSRNRDLVAFISDATGNPDLFVQEFSPLKGAIGKPRQIFYSKHGTQGTPSFDPTGKQIAFVSNQDGSPRIYILSIPEKNTKNKDLNIHLLNKFRRDCTAPAWSPDGQKIAYCAKVDGVRQILLFDLNKQKETQLTRGMTHKENPSWAPNSLHLTYNTCSDGDSELYIINLNTATSTKISSGKGEKRFPSWEPL